MHHPMRHPARWTPKVDRILHRSAPGPGQDPSNCSKAAGAQGARSPLYVPAGCRNKHEGTVIRDSVLSPRAKALVDRLSLFHACSIPRAVPALSCLRWFARRPTTRCSCRLPLGVPGPSSRPAARVRGRLAGRPPVGSWYTRRPAAERRSVSRRDEARDRAMGTFSGGCFCSSVRFEASEIFDAGYCHCSICQKFSGSPLCVWANTPGRAFRITAGEPKGSHPPISGCGTSAQRAALGFSGGIRTASPRETPRVEAQPSPAQEAGGARRAGATARRWAAP